MTMFGNSWIRREMPSPCKKDDVEWDYQTWNRDVQTREHWERIQWSIDVLCENTNQTFEDVLRQTIDHLHKQVQECAEVRHNEVFYSAFDDAMRQGDTVPHAAALDVIAEFKSRQKE